MAVRSHHYTDSLSPEYFNDNLQRSIDRATRPDGPFELSITYVNNSEFQIFKNAPPTLRDLFDQMAQFKDKEFCVFGNRRYTFLQFLQLSRKVGHALIQRGMKKGTRVGIAARNSPEWIAALMGVTSAGGIAVALNSWWTGDELAYAISDSGANFLFGDDERLKRIQDTYFTSKVELINISESTDRVSALDQWVGAAPETPLTQAIEPEDIATILYTSGSTSNPKGVMISHRAIIHSVLALELLTVSAFSKSSQVNNPATLLTMPLFHVSGMNGQMLSAIRRGRKLVGMSKWNPDVALKLIEKEAITYFNGVPTMASDILQSPLFEKVNLSSLQSFGLGGAGLAPSLVRELTTKLRIDLPATGYGLTETCGLGTVIGGEKLAENPQSSGRPVPPTVRVKIINSRGELMGLGKQGEIIIHGAMNFSGYWNDEEKTESTLVDGWVHTGDLGYINEAGFLFITDRLKDVIVRGAENISSQEVENQLSENPAIIECAVFGVPDDRLGEAVACVIMTSPDSDLSADDVLDHLHLKLARFKIPTYIDIRNQRLPRTASGKIFKRVLREETLLAMQ